MNPADLIGNIACEDATIPDIRELLGYINVALGGSRAYARMVAEDVTTADKGSTQRLSFHNNYLSAIAKFGGNDDLESANQQTLEAEAKRLIEEMQTDAKS